MHAGAISTEDLRKKIGRVLQRPLADAHASFEITHALTIYWSWINVDSGELMTDFPAPRLFDDAVVNYFASINMPCFLRYQGVAMLDQQRNTVHCVYGPLPAHADTILVAIEKLTNQLEVLETLLVNGQSNWGLA